MSNNEYDMLLALVQKRRSVRRFKRDPRLCQKSQGLGHRHAYQKSPILSPAIVLHQFIIQ